MKCLSPILALIAGSLLISQQGFAQNNSTYLMLGDSLSTLRAHISNQLQKNAAQLGLRYELAGHRHPFNNKWKSEVANHQAVLLVDRFPTVPMEERTLKVLQELGDSGVTTTYLLFIDNAPDVDWIGALPLPDNIRLAVSIKSIDAGELAHYYREVNIKYDQSAATIDYVSSVQMAMGQLAGAQATSLPYRLRKWESGKAYLGLFDDVVYSNADTEHKDALISSFLSNSNNVPPSWDQSTGVVVAPTYGTSEPTDIDAVLVALNEDECEGDYEWDGFIVNEMAFQAFGQIAD